jgi:hypothetical protein
MRLNGRMNESRVGESTESRVGGACRRVARNESRVGGACGPPPPFVAPLVPRCALTSGATPRDVLGRRLRLGRRKTLAELSGQLAPRALSAPVRTAHPIINARRART